MDKQEFFLRMVEYDRWANRECVNAVRQAKTADLKIVRLMAHTLSAERLWLERLQRQPQTMPVWPGSALEECDLLVDSVAESWKQYLVKLERETFDEIIEYRNSKGEQWSSRVEDVLTHVFLHSAYHRGQVALELRSAGFEPAYTDFIHAVRQERVR